MVKEDYEILPHSLLEDLKYDVEALKKKLQEPETKTNELILEIESLKDSIHELNEVFKKALDNSEDEDVFSSIKHLNERIDAVVTQNETIARGMIAISDKVDQFISANSTIASKGINVNNTGLAQTNNNLISPGRNVSNPSNMATANNASMVPAPPSFGGTSAATIGGIPAPPPGFDGGKKRHGFF
jgi:uncharacterized phage infection (PIP) family protein YhgE